MKDIIYTYAGAISDDFIIMNFNGKYPMLFGIILHYYKPIFIDYYIVSWIF